jgi:ubiquitin carboxyl-terminal hydrolase 8
MTITIDLSKYNNKGLSGLANLGNTCFINSCIQILSHTYELNEFLNNESFKNKLKNKHDSVLLLEWDNLRKILWNENCVVSPGKFISAIQKVAKIKNIEIFTGYLQNDASEFLLFLIDCFHNSISREVKFSISGNPENETDILAVKCFKMIENCYKNDYSEIWNLFYGVHVSEISRIDNGKVLSQTPEPYFMVDLPIPPNNKSPSLIDCFNYYVDGETIENYKDEESNETVNIKKKILFWSFPNILAIDLKRFNNRFQKNQIHINFPLDDLDLSNYVIGYKKDNYKYELYAVCNHSGNVMGGHYTSYVKNANGKWYHYNDTSVSEIGVNEFIISPKAYILFYRKKI